MKLSIPIFIVYGLLSVSAYADEINKKIDISLGEKLVREALNSTQYKNSGFEDPPDNSDETFLIYPVLGATEGFLAHYAVNPWTGDVWDMDQCKQISNPSLLKEQETIKKRFDMKELKEYDRLHKLKPYRMYNLESCL